MSGDILIGGFERCAQCGKVGFCHPTTFQVLLLLYCRFWRERRESFTPSVLILQLLLFNSVFPVNVNNRSQVQFIIQCITLSLILIKSFAFASVEPILRNYVN